MIVAFVGMLGVLGSTRYLSSFAMTSPPHGSAMTSDGPSPRWYMTHDATRSRSDSPGHIHIVPVRPGSHDVTITLEP